MQKPLPSLSSAFKVFFSEERHQEFSLAQNTAGQNESLAFMANNKRSCISNTNSSGGYNSNF